MYRTDGTPIAADNPILTGDHILLSIVGAGQTDPAVALGELTPKGVVAIRKIPVAVYITGPRSIMVNTGNEEATLPNVFRVQ